MLVQLKKPRTCAAIKLMVSGNVWGEIKRGGGKGANVCHWEWNDFFLFFLIGGSGMTCLVIPMFWTFDFSFFFFF